MRTLRCKPGHVLWGCAVALACASDLRAGETPCQPRWASGFNAGDLNGDVRTMVVWDNGLGPALYVGGSFTLAGGTLAQRVARWDGERWFAVGLGLGATQFDVVNALVVHNDGSGQTLFAGGAFLSSGAVETSFVAKWDGAAWQSVGSGTNNIVNALAVYDAGSGPNLYAGGVFDSAGGALAQGIARWNGQQWSALADGIRGFNRSVDALAVFPSGPGGQLYAGGRFTLAGPVSVSNIARWTGTSWSGVGTGISSNTGIARVRTLSPTTISGPALLVAGEFSHAGATPTANFARWTGSQWVGMGGGIGLPGESVRSIVHHDDGNGQVLYAGGIFTSAGGGAALNFARWNGVGWGGLGSGADGPVHAMASFFPTALPLRGGLFIGGAFATVNGDAAKGLARWRAAEWIPLGRGFNRAVHALKVYDPTPFTSPAPRLYAGGEFTYVNARRVDRVSVWQGSSWDPIPGGGADGPVRALGLYNFIERNLVVGGQFTTIGGVGASNVARFNGSSWFPMGSGINGPVHAIAGVDAGSTPVVFVGGQFTMAGGVPANNIAAWNSVGWSALGPGTTDTVRALAVGLEASTTVLYVGGDFFGAGASNTRHLAKWNGSAWSSVGGGVNGSVHAIALANLGQGLGVYIGGNFTSVGTPNPIPARRAARWSQSQWERLGEGMDGLVSTLTVFDDGSGPTLYAGGVFGAAGISETHGIARWNGTTWLGVDGPGIIGGTLSQTAVNAILGEPGIGGASPSLFVGGEFTAVNETTSGRIARLQSCAGPCPGDANGDARVDFLDLNLVLSAFGSPVTPGSSGDVNGDGVVDFLDLNEVLSYFGSVC